MYLDLDELGRLLFCPRCGMSPMRIGRRVWEPDRAEPRWLAAGHFVAWCGECHGEELPRRRSQREVADPRRLISLFGKIPESRIPPLVHLSFDDSREAFAADCRAIELGVLELPRRA